jgi:hypothetical protein
MVVCWHRQAERQGRWPHVGEGKLGWRPVASQEGWAERMENEVGPTGLTSQKGGSVSIRLKWSLS